MRILYEYCVEKIKNNKKISASIMIAIFIAATFFGTFSLIIDNYRQFLVQQEISENGDWDAELLEVTGKKYMNLKKESSIEKIMSKGDNEVTLLPDGIKQKYFYIQNCDTEYWRNMNEKSHIIQGRTPNSENEIVVSERFFSENPSYKLGDIVTVTLGERKEDKEAIDFLSPERSNEVFIEKNKKELEIVGIIDTTISSAYNGYASYGWLDTSKLTDEADLVTYIQMRDQNNVYEDVPRIAENINLIPDEYGEYPYKYNTNLLEYEGIFAPGKFWNSDYPKLFGVGILLVIGTIVIFAYIIKGAFEIAEQKSTFEYGILKSVGATPKQIKILALAEAAILSIIPIILSQVISYCIAKYIFKEYIKTLSSNGTILHWSFSTSLSIGIGVILTLATVFIAALRQSKYVAKSVPIEILKGENKLIRGSKYSSRGQRGNIYAVLAQNNLRKNKRLFRSCTITLSLGLLVTLCFLTIFTVSDINNTQAENDNYFNINVTLQQGVLPDPALISDIRSAEGIESLSQFSMANCAMWILEDQFSDDLMKNKGLSTKTAKETILFRDGKYRIPCLLIGLEKNEYDNYVKTLNNFDVSTDAVIVNSVTKNPDSKSYDEQKKKIQYLNISSGEDINLTEKFLDSMDGDFEFKFDNVCVTDSMPNIGRNIPFYNLPIIISADKYNEIISEFSEERKVANNRLYINILSEKNKEKRITKQINAICDSVMNSSDYYTSCKIERAETRKEMIKSSMLIAYSITGLFTVVGVSSVIVAVFNSLCQRRRELAVLRSVGVDKRGLNYLLKKEGILLALKPSFVCCVIWIVFSSILLKVQDISWIQFLKVFGIGKILLLFGAVFLMIFLIYYKMSRMIRKENIIEAIREQNV